MLLVCGLVALSLAIAILGLQVFAPADLPAVLLAAVVPSADLLLATALLVAAAAAAGLARRAWRRQRRASARWAGLVAFGALVPAAAGVYRAWPVRRTAVSFLADDGTRLAGTLSTPRGVARPWPGVVLAPGSAAAPARAYGYVADRLCRAGFAVLAVDKRGVGGSGGAYDRNDNSSPATLALLGGDLAAAFRWLAARAEIDGARSGYWGVSQAGWTVPIALAQSPQAAFALLVSGPVATVGEENLWSALAGEDADPFGAREPPLPFEAIERRLDAAAPRGFDPQPLLARLDVPMLYVFGAWDNSIPARRSAARVDALRAAGRPFRAVVVPEADHLLLIARGPRRGLLPAFAPGVWELEIAWMRERAAAAGARSAR